jgi:hypothetical protein
MKFLTIDALIICKHQTGKMQMPYNLQNLVTIKGRPVMVEHDPVAKPITGCANVGLTIKPCTLTLAVSQGYSQLIFINNRPVCLDTVTGLTDGTPPGVVAYNVRNAGQDLVEEQS